MNIALNVKKNEKEIYKMGFSDDYNKQHSNVTEGRMRPDLSYFIKSSETKSLVTSVKDIGKDEFAKLEQVGVDLKEKHKTGGYLLYGIDEITVSSEIEGIEILPVSKALTLYPYIKEKYFYNAVDKDIDEFTRLACKEELHGYFIRVRKNVQMQEPVCAGLFMHMEKSTMCVHNIVILEEGARLHLITGCTSGNKIREGLHIAISEHYLGKKAVFINTMIHDWGPGFVVHPATATFVNDEGAYVNNYYSVNTPGYMESKPFTCLSGKASSAKYMTVLASAPDTYCDIGGTVLMKGDNASSELIARAVNHGGTVIQSGLLTGAAKGTRGHVDCSGLMLSENGIIEAIPGLKSLHPDARLSHEAAIGRINMGEVNYLMSKGLEEMQAIALIIRGFLDTGIEAEGLDKGLEDIIKQISELSGHGE